MSKNRKPRTIITAEETIQAYLNKGWIINDLRKLPDYFLSEYSIYSPEGVVFRSYDLTYNHCPFCEEDEDEPEGEDEDEQFECVHSPELLRQEKEAKNLLNFIKLKEGDTILMCQL